MEIGLVRKVDIDHEMQQSYLDYAMSVIVARALPDARDGLKPVQRRILYAMYDMGLRSNTATKKSARIVGEVLGKYHPHGDMSVYEAMARMAQDFTLRYPLVEGQGNFGSVDGDPPAAMRYTEARLTSIAMEELEQIDRDTVDFGRNFDDTLSEPEVLPSAIPNLLVNGANGIAVGMATSIPPHNLNEVVDALVYMLQQWEKLDDIAVQDLMRFVLGPDLPTGGIIIQENNGNDLLSAYGTGKGKVTVRGRVHTEEMGRGKSRIIITELPYLTNKTTLIERIAELARDGQLDGVADLRDESDRQGMRIVIDLNKAEKEENILRELYKRTPLESTLSIMLLALVDGEPRMLNLKQALRVYLDHRLVVVRRRSEFDLRRCKQRAHILEGLRIAIKNLDEIIALIRNSADTDQARERLMKKYSLSDVQAQAILDMPLKRLASLERKKIEQEYKELTEQIKELEALLKSDKRQRQVVEEELLAVRQTYGDRRRTQIVLLREGESSKSLLTTTDLTPEQVVWVGLTEDGILARTHSDVMPRLSGRQVPRWLLRTNSHHTLYLVSREGKAAAVAVHALPEAEKFSEGVPFHKASPFTDEDQLVGMFAMPLRDVPEDRYLITVSRYGMVKKTVLTELPGPSAQLFQLAKVNPGDQLGWLLLTNGQADVLLAAAGGMVIRFSEQEVRPMGLVAAGVNGIKLGEKDELVGAVCVQGEGELLLLANNGYAWRMPAAEIPTQGRYGQGVIGCKLTRGSRLIGAHFGLPTQGGIVHYERAAARSLRLDEVPLGKRASAGKAVLAAKEGDQVSAWTAAFDGMSFWGAKAPAQRKTRKSTPKAPTLF